MYIRIPDEETERRQENRTNIVKRHCRIGKVSPKPPKRWLDRSIKSPQPLIPWTPSMETGYAPAWWQNPVVSTC
jgi:hypothetical protein